MASFFTSSYAGTILSNLFSGAYIGLSTSTPTDTGTNITEPGTSAGYARVAASTGGMTVTDGTITNQNYIYYPESTASWGTVTYLFLSSSSSVGTTGSTVRYIGELTSSVAIGADTVPLFRPGALSVTITDASA